MSNNTEKYDASRESYLQQSWIDLGIHNYPENHNTQANQGNIYSIDTPPPTVSGKIHIGHIFSYTQAEVVARFRRMVGDVVFYPFGFDDNGLPSEKLVEKEIGAKGSELSREKFNEKCLEITKKYREKFKNIWEMMGFSVDWNLSYSTISPEVQKASQISFLRLYKQGIIYNKEAPCIWCPECQTAIAQAEIEKKELPSTFYDIEFNLKKGGKINISTTRPELLPACVGVFVNPTDSRYTNLIGETVCTPLGTEVKIIADDKVDTNKGTGVVMCCTYGDETDMFWVKKYSLEEKIILDRSGKMTNTFPEINGMYYKKARKHIIEILEKNDYIKSKKDITHDVGVHERCGIPTEILNVKQWFVKTLEIKDKLIELGDKINWHPAHMKKRYTEWVENLKWDWCISRQRYFGIPIPVWYDNKGDIILPEEDQLPINPINSKPNAIANGIGSENIIPETDVLDTWATSSLTPLINANFFDSDNKRPGLLPMSLRPQAHDIIRTWTLYTIIMSYYHTGNIPFNNIMVSGHVLASKTEKISKSKENAGITPEDLIKKYGADAVRYWACGGSLGKDIVFEESEVIKGKKLVTKLWNASIFAQKYLEDYENGNTIQEKDIENIDKWLLSKINSVSKIMITHYENFNVGLALAEFERFFWNDFCDNYLEIVKGKSLNLENNINGKKVKKSYQFTLHNAILNIIKIIAPILPHITEEIFQRNYSTTDVLSIHTSKLKINKDCDKNLNNLNNNVKKLFEIFDLTRKYKSEKQIKYGQQNQEIIINASLEDIDILKDYKNEILAIAKTNEISFNENNGETSVIII